jgi:hypothetical protein
VSPVNSSAKNSSFASGGRLIIICRGYAEGRRDATESYDAPAPKITMNILRPLDVLLTRKPYEGGHTRGGSSAGSARRFAIISFSAAIRGLRG